MNRELNERLRRRQRERSAAPKLCVRFFTNRVKIKIKAISRLALEAGPGLPRNAVRRDLEEDHTEAVHVRFLVVLLAEGQLRCHVVWGP